MSKMGRYVFGLQEKEQEIEMAISEAKSLCMGSNVPNSKIISHAAKLAKCSESEVETFYYNGAKYNVESTPW